MSDAEKCLQFLKRVVEENLFVQQTIDSFWESFSTYKEEDAEEYRSIFGDGTVSIVLDDMTVALVWRKQSTNDNFAHFVISYNIYFKQKCEMSIGYYKLIFSLGGEIYDDILYFD